MSKPKCSEGQPCGEATCARCVYEARVRELFSEHAGKEAPFWSAEQLGSFKVLCHLAADAEAERDELRARVEELEGAQHEIDNMTCPDCGCVVYQRQPAPTPDLAAKVAALEERSERADRAIGWLSKEYDDYHGFRAIREIARDLHPSWRGERSKNHGS